MIQIASGWQEKLKDEFSKEYFVKLGHFLDDEYNNSTIFPKREDVFNALNITDVNTVKVVILGQDPYHDDNQAHGLSFSIPKSQKKIPPSLNNIYKELNTDCDCYIPNNGNLTKWACQGVLLLNTVLTVRAHEAGTHRGKGWEKFTDEIFRILNKQDRPIVFMLWGKDAIKKGKILDNPNHLVLTAAHPSPLSAYRGFFGCKHFSKANSFLVSNDIDAIDWQIENV